MCCVVAVESPEVVVVVVDVVVSPVGVVVVVCVVVVVVGVGFSTTVVQDVNRRATAKSGMRMISFFIVEICFPSQTDSVQMPQPDVFRTHFSKGIW